MKPTYLLKVLNHHARPARSSAAKETSGARHWGVHVFSGDRRCTCGRDKAIDELTTLLENQQTAPREELTLAQLRRRLATLAQRITPRICAEGYPVRADATGASAHGANGQDETGFHFGRVSVKRTSPTSAARAAEDGKDPRNDRA